MTRVIKLALIAVAVAGIASPSFAKSRHHTVAAQSGFSAFAMVPGGAFSPAANGGGSIGYNENLRRDAW